MLFFDRGFCSVIVVGSSNCSCFLHLIIFSFNCYLNLIDLASLDCWIEFDAVALVNVPKWYNILSFAVQPLRQVSLYGA